MIKFNKIDGFFLIAQLVALGCAVAVNLPSWSWAVSGFFIGTGTRHLLTSIWFDRQREITRESVASRTLAGLESFADRLESGEPIYVTRMTRYETPDGPRHSFDAGELSEAGFLPEEGR